MLFPLADLFLFTMPTMLAHSKMFVNSDLVRRCAVVDLPLPFALPFLDLPLPSALPVLDLPLPFALPVLDLPLPFHCLQVYVTAPKGAGGPKPVVADEKTPLFQGARSAVGAKSV